MADETKIACEVLTEEQLDGVAGGTALQSEMDTHFLQKIGAMTTQEPGALEKTWAKMGVAIIEHSEETRPNQYFNNGAQISRMDALKLAAKKMKNKTVNVLDYDI